MAGLNNLVCCIAEYPSLIEPHNVSQYDVCQWMQRHIRTRTGFKLCCVSKNPPFCWESCQIWSYCFCL